MIKMEFYIVITSWNKDLKLQKTKEKTTESIRLLINILTPGG